MVNELGLATLQAVADLSGWINGVATSVAGSAMGVQHLMESNTVHPVRNEGGIWSGKAWAFSATSVAVDGNSQNQANSPITALFSFIVNNGAPGDAVAILGDALANTNNTTVFGGNLIARTAAGLTGVKLVGLEIDVEPATGVTPAAGSAGLLINVFETATPGPAIQTGQVSGGSFNNGLVLGGLASTGAGVSPNGGAAMDSLVNSGAGTFTSAAIILSNTHRVRFKGTAAAHGSIYMHSDDRLRIVGGTAGFTVRDNADTMAFLSIDANGASVFKSPASTTLSVVYDATTAGQVVQNIFRDATVDKWYYRKTTGNQLDWYSSVLAATVLTLNDTGLVAVSGSFGRGAPVIKTGDFTITASENSLINNKSGSTCTVTLPAVATFPGREIFILNYQAQTVVSNASNVVPRAGGAAGTAILAATSGAWALLVSDGSAWRIVISS